MKEEGRLSKEIIGAAIDVLTRKIRYQPPKIKDTLHMLRDSTAYLHLADQVRLLSRQKPSFDFPA